MHACCKPQVHASFRHIAPRPHSLALGRPWQNTCRPSASMQAAIIGHSRSAGELLTCITTCQQAAGTYHHISKRHGHRPAGAPGSSTEGQAGLPGLGPLWLCVRSAGSTLPHFRPGAPGLSALSGWSSLTALSGRVLLASLPSENRAQGEPPVCEGRRDAAGVGAWDMPPGVRAGVAGPPLPCFCRHPGVSLAAQGDAQP